MTELVERLSYSSISAYLAALEQMGHTGNPERLFRHYVLVRGRVPRVQIFETHRTDADIEWLFDLIRSVWRGIKLGLFHPNPTHRWCKPRYCEYWNMCRGREPGS
jgi:hypothetical protein